MNKNNTSKGTGDVFRIKPARCCINSKLVYNSDGRSLDKEKQSVQDFLLGYKCGSITHISGQHNAWNLRVLFN